MTAVLELALRPLPQSVKPFPGEIVSSYVGRLADANRVDTTALLRYITGTKQTHNVPVERLAIVSGIPHLVLERAIGDLDNAKPTLKHYHSHDRSIAIRTEVSGPACQLCAAVAGATRPVTCRRPAEKVLCLRHRRWIGSGDAFQPSLDHQPDILKAHMRHLRLVRRLGREEATAAFTIAADICRQWHDHREHDEEFRRRLEIFHGPGWQVALYHPTVAAAAYPQVVALARLLASPYWKSLGSGSSATGASLFALEMRRTVAPSYRWPRPRGSKDPLYRWLIGDVQFERARRRTGSPSSGLEPWDLPIGAHRSRSLTW